MRPMLDDLELPQVQEAAIGEQRALAEHHAPHADGSVLQDLGRHAARVRLWGVATGPDAAEFVEKLASRFRAGEPVPFTADITSGTAIERMSIADLQLREAAGKPGRWVYALALDEYIEPPPAVSAAAGVDAAVADEGRGLMDGLANALDLMPILPTGLEPFVPVLQGLLDRLRGS
jgi:hypothetical protein